MTSMQWMRAAATAHVRLRRGFAAAFATVLMGFGAQATENIPPSPDLEEMLVIGEQPGPGVWKVTNGAHTLWILAVQQPLPKELVWRSQRVENLIAQSHELITAAGTSVDPDLGVIGFFTGLRAFIRARKLPDGQTLNQVLAPDVYRKWRALKGKHVGANKGIERMRPVWAAQELQRIALKEAGFARKDAISEAVRKLAKKHRLEITSAEVEVELKLDDPAELFDRIGQLTIEDHGCFERTLDELDDRLDMKRDQANAWSVGDVTALLTLHQQPQAPECMGEMMQAMMLAGGAGKSFGPKELMEWMRKEQPRALAETRQRWLAAAERALEENRSTFALLKMVDVVDPKGPLQSLRDRGYVVEPPPDAHLSLDVERAAPPAVEK